MKRTYKLWAVTMKSEELFEKYFSETKFHTPLLYHTKQEALESNYQIIRMIKVQPVTIIVEDDNEH
jgi:hypothetical protein